MRDRPNGVAVRFLPCADTALVVEFGAEIDPRVNANVLALFERLNDARIPGVVEAVPTFRSLMVHYDPTRIAHRELKSRLQELLKGLVGKPPRRRRWTIPVCYGGEHGPDLDDVARRTGLSAKQVIEAHSAAAYNVYMIGFLPGFPYMGGLPERLALPRHQKPRVKLARGSVAIAMAMTAIYPVESPGGWNLLGRTPMPLWDLRLDPPAVLAPGDEVRFKPISAAEFERLERRAAAGALPPEPERAAT